MARQSQDRLKLLQKMLAERGIDKQERQGIPRWPGPGSPPLSLNQHRLWYLDRLEPGTSLYNDCVTVRLRGAELDVAAFERAFAEIVRRHDSMRSYFVTENAVAAQRADADLTIPVDFVDLRELPAEERTARVQERLLADVREPFDLSAPPLVRATLFRLADDSYEFGLTMHHIMSDGASYGVIYDELSRLYPAFCAGDPSPLPELPAQIGDYAAWERARIDERVVEEKLEYWRKKLAAPLPVLNLPTDNPRSSAGNHRGAFHRFEVPAPLFRSLQDYCRREQVTSYWVLITSWVATLYRFSGQDDILIGTPSSCRSHPDLEPMIGFFVKTVVIRNDLGGNPTLRDLLGRTQQTALEAHDHDDAPFDRIVQEVRPDAASAKIPMLQAWFTHMRDMIPVPRLPGFEASYEIVDPKNARFDVALIMDETQDGISAYFEYDVDLFTPTTVRLIADQYMAVLRHAIDHPDTTLRTLRDTLRAAERPASDPGKSKGVARLKGMKKLNRKAR